MLRRPTFDHPDVPAVCRAASALQEHFGDAPPLAMVLGTGLGPVVDAAEVIQRVDYRALELPVSRITGHAGEAVLGVLGGQRVLLMSGRVHGYEGGPMAEVVRATRALHAWGVGHLLLTCSVGGLHPHLPPGTLVRLVDHLNFMGDNPLVGPAYGTRFPDLQHAYSPRLGGLLDVAAEREEVDLPHGVLAAMRGPAYESSAEVRMVRMLGADVVGMSTVPEVLAATALGQSVGAVAVVSNFATGVTDGPVDHASVTRVAGEAARNLARVVSRAMQLLPKLDALSEG